jgi:sodium/bile acid cotransporter 7
MVPDLFVVLLIGTVAIASLLPCRGTGAIIFGWITNAAIFALFFLHGSRLPRDAVIAGLRHWRLHLLVAGCTFVLFPAIGLLVVLSAAGRMDAMLLKGILFLSLLPSTVQSSIAFTSIGRGNVPAAVCSAALSNVAGIIVTPILVGLFMDSAVKGGVANPQAIEAIAIQLLLPFLAGHLSRPLTSPFLARHRAMGSAVDRGSILLVVYTAFSAAVAEGLWTRLSAADIVLVVLLDSLILAVAIAVATVAARGLGFSKEDEIAIVFCGSKKSLASGVPMAASLFPAATVGPLIVPLMVFHQIQLIVCSVIARHYAARADADDLGERGNPCRRA